MRVTHVDDIALKGCEPRRGGLRPADLADRLALRQSDVQPPHAGHHAPGAGTLVATISSASTTTYHVSSLTANTAYYFKLKTYDDGDPALTVISNQVSATTRTTGNDLPQTTIISYSYDEVGRKTSMTDQRGPTRYTYNAGGRLTQVKDPNAYTVDYEYDDNGRRTKMTDQFSGETTYTYNAGGRLTKVTDPDLNDFDFTYNDAGRVTRQDNENGTYTLYTYVNRGWVDTITHKKSGGTTFLSLDYTYDKLGNRTKVEEDSGDYVDYTYDDRYRLTRETRKDDQAAVEYDYSYEYDAVGNRTKKTDEETEDETSYTYNSMNQMTAAGNITYTWDDAGNMATKVANQQTTTYTWDFRNKMLEVDFPTGDDVSLRYDGHGSRCRKRVGATTTKFLFDAQQQVAALLFELDGSDTVQAQYGRNPRGLLLAMKRGATVSTYHYEVLGSTRALTNGSETVTDTYEYDAWGNSTASSGSTANPLKFVGMLGYYDDPNVGMMLLGARHYHAAAGRFISLDLLKDGPNWYAYARGNPLVYVDPTGNWSQETEDCIRRKCDPAYHRNRGTCLKALTGSAIACGIICGLIAVGDCVPGDEGIIWAACFVDCMRSVALPAYVACMILTEHEYHRCVSGCIEEFEPQPGPCDPFGDLRCLIGDDKFRLY